MHAACWGPLSDPLPCSSTKGRGWDCRGMKSTVGEEASGSLPSKELPWGRSPPPHARRRPCALIQVLGDRWSDETCNVPPPVGEAA